MSKFEQRSRLLDAVTGVETRSTQTPELLPGDIDTTVLSGLLWVGTASVRPLDVSEVEALGL